MSIIPPKTAKNGDKECRPRQPRPDAFTLLNSATKLAIVKASESLSRIRPEQKTAGNAQKMSKKP